MGVAMTEEEVRGFLAAAHTGVLSTLRADGRPAAVPLWFVLDGADVVVRTRSGSAKAANVRRDPRVSFLVEEGRAWAELRAVAISGRAVAERDPAARARIDAAFAAKYAAFLMPSGAPDASRRHYAAPRVHLRIEAAGRPLSWDNSKLLRGAPAPGSEDRVAAVDG